MALAPQGGDLFVAPNPTNPLGYRRFRGGFNQITSLRTLIRTSDPAGLNVSRAYTNFSRAYKPASGTLNKSNPVNDLLSPSLW